MLFLLIAYGIFKIWSIPGIWLTAFSESEGCSPEAFFVGAVGMLPVGDITAVFSMFACGATSGFKWPKYLIPKICKIGNHTYLKPQGYDEYVEKVCVKCGKIVERPEIKEKRSKKYLKKQSQKELAALLIEDYHKTRRETGV